MKSPITTLLIATSLFIQLSCTNNAGSVPVRITQEVPTDTSKFKIPDTLSITAVGDIMIGSAYPQKTNLPPDDGVNSFKKVESFLKGDIVFGNLEGCFLNNGKSTKCKDPNSNSCFAFRMPERYAGIIKSAGFNVLSIANNHVGDFGLAGRNKTVAILDSLNIVYAGLQSHPFNIFEKDSVKYAFCAFAPNENTVSINKVDSAKQLVMRLKAQADIVIVSFHGGAEGAKHEHVPKRKEIFYGENRGDVHAFAHAVIDAGADVVLGHGPHVTRAVEVYKNKFIAYSLGNFNTYGMFSLKGPNGIAPLLQLKINSKGDFLFADIISVKQDKINRLQLDPENAAFHKIKLLTNTDFPGHRLDFSEANRIKVKD
ncbi:CapA family protein [Pedobacter sp. ASV1-7]|uniref:CapA family protein n=1 Tax=Pedobacter sp. ASV1-7 TaxID=3145237 RepID=UPI0032E84E75